METARKLHILNLGAGVQSTALYLMSMRGQLPDTTAMRLYACGECFHMQDSMEPCQKCGSVRTVRRSFIEEITGRDFQDDCPRIRFDYAIFADTQEEPAEVYRHLEWLKSLGGPPIIEPTAGKLGDDLISATNTTGQPFQCIPAFVAGPDSPSGGMRRRQCTKEYKIEPVERAIRRQILELEPRKRIPKDVHIEQYIGMSFDEPRRVIRVKARFQSIPWSTPHFPLFEMEMTRRDCESYLKSVVPHSVPKSACVFCPFRDNQSWRHLRDTDPAGWERACQVDEGMRANDTGGSRGLDLLSYVHKSCVPLREAKIDTLQSRGEQSQFGFDQECEGMCGV